jgi:hypothetical protein|tara:strand:- start:449 stop:559 length:111 start_codon:yes stop_codon:yes gene_type:complete
MYRIYRRVNPFDICVRTFVVDTKIKKEELLVFVVVV